MWQIILIIFLCSYFIGAVWLSLYLRLVPPEGGWRDYHLWKQPTWGMSFTCGFIMLFPWLFWIIAIYILELVEVYKNR